MLQITNKSEDMNLEINELRKFIKVQMSQILQPLEKSSSDENKLGLEEQKKILQNYENMENLLEKLSAPQDKIDVVGISNLIDNLDNNLPFKQQLATSFAEIKYKISPIEESIRYIDDYEAFTVQEDNRHPRDFVNALLTDEESRQMLYAKTEINQSARENFMHYLQDRLRNSLPQKGDPAGKTINIEGLLEKKGLELYKLAISEESKSPAFRAAVFKSATKGYDGPQWDKKLILWVGGPSASGKSFSATKAVEQMSHHMPTSLGGNAKNYVVSIDGGIEREVSQMRQLILQVALSQGYKGIEDLHEVTKKEMNIKKYIKNAALHQRGISLVIPETFVESGLKPLNYFIESDMSKYHKREDVVQAFAEIVGHPDINFGSTVAHMGNSRAWLEEGKHFDRKNIKINNRNIGCESKAYGGKGFNSGVFFSGRAREHFKEVNPEGRYIKITNDIVFAHKEKDQWKICGENDKPQIKLSKRDFDKWEKEAKQYEIELSDWYETQNKAPVIIENMRISDESKREEVADKSKHKEVASKPFGLFGFDLYKKQSSSGFSKEKKSDKNQNVEERKGLLSKFSDKKREKDDEPDNKKGKRPGQS